MSNAAGEKTGNQILDSLPPEDCALVLPHLKPVVLPLRTSLHKADEPITDIYFVTKGIVSMVSTLQNGSSIELGIIGAEGFAGMAALLGASTAATDAYMQVAGAGLRLPTATMLEIAAQSMAFRRGLFRYAQFLFAQVSQTAACNAHHSLESRLARWLLSASDRLSTDLVPLTQEFLAIMLGVQRPGVSIAAAALKRLGMIEYVHGRINILDRPALEATSCECYGVIKAELARVYE